MSALLLSWVVLLYVGFSCKKYTCLESWVGVLGNMQLHFSVFVILCYLYACYSFVLTSAMWRGNNIAMFLKEYITLCTSTRHTIDALTSFNIFQQINSFFFWQKVSRDFIGNSQFTLNLVRFVQSYYGCTNVTRLSVNM